jgi:hypothetical protein
MATGIVGGSYFRPASDEADGARYCKRSAAIATSAATLPPNRHIAKGAFTTPDANLQPFYRISTPTAALLVVFELKDLSRIHKSDDWRNV